MKEDKIKYWRVSEPCDDEVYAWDNVVGGEVLRKLVILHVYKKGYDVVVVYNTEEVVLARFHHSGDARQFAISWMKKHPKRRK